MTGDPDTELTLAFLRDARELAEAEQADAEYDALFGGEEDVATPFHADAYEARRIEPVVLNANKPVACDERESRKLRRIPGLLVRV